MGWSLLTSAQQVLTNNHKIRRVRQMFEGCTNFDGHKYLFNFTSAENLQDTSRVMYGSGIERSINLRNVLPAIINYQYYPNYRDEIPLAQVMYYNTGGYELYVITECMLLENANTDMVTVEKDNTYVNVPYYQYDYYNLVDNFYRGTGVMYIEVDDFVTDEVFFVRNPDGSFVENPTLTMRQTFANNPNLLHIPEFWEIDESVMSYRFNPLDTFINCENADNYDFVAENEDENIRRWA